MPDNSQAQPWGLGAIMPSMKRTHQKGTKLEDCGDAWRIRYRHYFVDKQGVRRSTRLTKYFYKRDYEGSKRLAERAVADFMRQVNEGNTNPQRAATFGEMAEKRTVSLCFALVLLIDKAPAYENGIQQLKERGNRGNLCGTGGNMSAHSSEDSKLDMLATEVYQCFEGSVQS